MNVNSTIFLGMVLVLYKYASPIRYSFNSVRRLL